MSNVAIIHFQPLELYPPIQNLIRFIESRLEDNKLIICTTAAKTNNRQFNSTSTKIKIKVLGRSGNKLPPLQRYYYYLVFNLGCLIHLILTKPQRILYYETISSFPVFIYKKYINPKTEILIHYHEYTSPEEYKMGMKLVKLFHKYEKELYPITTWISHTNEQRMQHFVNDIAPILARNQYILPNYPPKTWYSGIPVQVNVPIKIIYVGSFSMDTMYTLEFAKWVISQNGKVTWDIYSPTITEEIAEYFNSLGSPWINILGSVTYDELPNIIRKYNIGVVLYNGHIPNYIYNAPNKLFEYLACGLDVWVPTVMTGSLPYITNSTYPKVIGIDFTALPDFILSNAIDRNGYVYKPTTYFCEYVLEDIVKQLLKNG